MSEELPVEESSPAGKPENPGDEGRGDDRVSYESFTKALDEKKAAQRKLAEFERKEKEREEALLQEQGKFKELLEERQKELDSLKPGAERWTKYEERITSKIETIRKGLPETKAKWLDKFQGDIVDKLDMAEELAAEATTKPPIASDRPGGKGAENSFDLSEYKGPEGRTKLLKLSKENPAKYKEIVAAKNKLL